MKVRWRQHEMILVLILTVVGMIGGLARLLISPAPISEMYAMYKGVVAVQLILPVIHFSCYFLINYSVIRNLTPAKGEAISSMIPRYVWKLGQLLILVYILGPVSNFIALYLTDHIPDHGIVNAVNAYLPMHPQPFFNVFGGFDIALFFTIAYLLYVLVREMLIARIERQDGAEAFRILIANQISILALLYFAGIGSVLILIPHLYVRGSTAAMIVFVIPCTIALIIANIYWLFPSMSTVRHKRSTFITRLLLLTCAAAFPFTLLQRAEIEGRLKFFIGAWLFQLLIVAPLSWVIYLQRREKILRIKGMQQELTRTQADLNQLRSQINPHFLFNTLNTLYGTALQEGSKRTAQGIQMLGDMMRFMLHENHLETISLGREIEYMQNYIRLQRLRIESASNIHINTNISNNCTHQIAPMLLIPLVENAFKHGISLVRESWIDIQLSCDDDSLRFAVKNSLQPVQSNDTERNNSGVGLINVRERLALLYPGAHEFKAASEGNEYVASISISFARQKTSSDS